MILENQDSVYYIERRRIIGSCLTLVGYITLMNILKLIFILGIDATKFNCRLDKPKVVRHFTKDFDLDCWSELSLLN